MLDSKLALLKAKIRNYNSVLIAYSGGVDSVFLAFLAHTVLPAKSVAVIADSPSLPRRELDDALQIAAKFRFPVRVIETAEFSNPNYTTNPLERCYFCKHELFEQLAPLAKQLGLSVIAYGENASDIGNLRPGARAAVEFRICAPLKEVGLTKAEIRSLSARFGLPTTDKPQMACLSSRIPHGENVTIQKLQMVETAENFLRDFGFFDVRVRHHQLTQTPSLGSANATTTLDALAVQNVPLALARVEVGVAELPRLLDPTNAVRIVNELKRIGYFQVTLDPQGYRSGGANDLTLRPAD